MYFILSKILLCLLFPVCWILVLLLISFITRNQKLKRRSFIAAVVLLIIFTNTFIFNLFAKRWDIPAAQLKDNEKYSCAIILGGFSGVNSNGKGRFNSSADRFIEGVELFTTHRVTHILITSGNGSLLPNGFSEGDWVRTQLKAFGIPDSAILIENKSRNTIENARFSKIILKKSSLPEPYLLVTSAFHMRRSAMIFRKEEIKSIPYPCNFFTAADSYTFDDYFIPSAEVLSNWNLYAKEVVGYIINSFNA